MFSTHIVCVGMCVCVHACAQVFVVEARGHYQVSFSAAPPYFLRWDFLLHRKKLISLTRLAGPRALDPVFIPLSKHWDWDAAMLSFFYTDAGDLNSGPRACAASTLLIEPPLQVLDENNEQSIF